jgi:hypothetical protein
VREVGADDDQRVVVAPQSVEHAGDLRGAGVADDERHEGEVVTEHALQERELDLERVLARVGLARAQHLRQRAGDLTPSASTRT